MKAFLISLGIIAAIGGVMVLVFLVKAVGVVRNVHGQALYSSVGAWTRIQEFARAQGNSNYIAEADSKLAMLENDLKAWRESSASSKDLSAFEKLRTTAYETTDRNIKSGQNPLAYLDVVMVETGAASATQSKKPAGMSEFDYLACDGGPHLVLPKELSRQWKGANSLLSVLSPTSDYGRACTAVTNQHMALIPVGSGQAMVLADPPLSAWGRSTEGWIDIYYLDGWSDTDTDALVKRAVSATPTSVMKDTGKMMRLKEPGLILLFAGDQPGTTAYGESEIPIDAGNYRILEGHYTTGKVDAVYIYRLQPLAK